MAVPAFQSADTLEIFNLKSEGTLRTGELYVDSYCANGEMNN